MGKLPLAFKAMGLSVHSEFDSMAKAAEARATPKDLLLQLSGTLQTCVACHEQFQFNSPSGAIP